ncbi:MAG TPA: hypothetical protein DCQ94_21480 [Nitrospira sp.]|nr:hypothetical protein [Nitrospira sp.]
MRQSLEPLVVNGAHGEGGGALFRTALSMSALTQQPVKVHTIRGAMRKTGLNSEDMTFMQGLSLACAAEVIGDELDSREVIFRPTRPIRPVNHRLDVQAHEKGNVPGNAITIAESLLPMLARAGGYSQLTLVGETHNNNTLTYDSFERVTLAAHRRQGLYAFPSLLTAGYGYAARGEVAVEIEPSAFEPIVLNSRGDLLRCRAVISGSDVPQPMLDDAADQIRGRFAEIQLECEAEAIMVRGRSPGLSITIWSEFENGFGSASATMQRGMNLQQTLHRAWAGFLEWMESNATVDAYLADQLLLPAALCEGRSAFRTPKVTRRLQTMAFVIKQFLPIKITIIGQEGEPGSVTVER